LLFKGEYPLKLSRAVRPSAARNDKSPIECPIEALRDELLDVPRRTAGRSRFEKEYNADLTTPQRFRVSNSPKLTVVVWGTGMSANPTAAGDSVLPTGTVVKTSRMHKAKPATLAGEAIRMPWSAVRLPAEWSI